MRRGLLVPSLAAIAVFALTFSLGNWQMNRAAEKAGLQAARDAADRREPLRIGGASAVALPRGGVAVGQRVVVTGRFLPQSTVLIDNRTHQGISGVHVVTALRVEAAGAHSPALVIPVLRGWIARDPADRSRLPAVATPAGAVEVEGRVESELARALELGPSAQGDGPLWQNFERERFERRVGETLVAFIVRQNVLRGAPDDALVREWPNPGDGVARHHGYAFQWYGLAALVAGLWGWFVIRESRVRGKLILIVALCVAPVIASYLAYYVFPPTGRVHYGALIEPSIGVDDLAVRSRPPASDAGATRTDDAASFAALRGRWALVMMAPGACGGECAQRLYAIRQIRLALGRDAERVERVWLVTDDQPPSADLLAQHSGLRVWLAPLPALRERFASGERPDGLERIFLLDPRGQLIMDFPPGADPSRIRKDLARLLKISRIG